MFTQGRSSNVHRCLESLRILVPAILSIKQRLERRRPTTGSFKCGNLNVHGYATSIIVERVSAVVYGELQLTAIFGQCSSTIANEMYLTVANPAYKSACVSSW